MLSNSRNMGNLKQWPGVTSQIKLISTSTYHRNSLLYFYVHLGIIFAISNGAITISSSKAQSIPSYNRISSSLFNSQSASNEIPRLPIWNSASFDDSRHVDLSQLRQLIGEPRVATRDVSQLINRPKPKCNRRIRILNGVTRIRERGSLARFQCSHGFTLIGPTTIVCLRDEWSEPSPICVRNGCRSLDVPRNGVKRESIGGAVSAFFCLGNSVLIGDNILFCDGVKWNGTAPTCHTPTTTTTTLEPTTEEEELWPVSTSTPVVVRITNPDSIWNSSVITNGHSTTEGTEDFSKFVTESYANHINDTEHHIMTVPGIAIVTPTLPSHVTHHNAETLDNHESEITGPDLSQLHPTTESVPKQEITEGKQLEVVTTGAPNHETGESLDNAIVTTGPIVRSHENTLGPVQVTTASISSITEPFKVDTTSRSVVSSSYPIAPVHILTTTTVKPKTTTRRFKIRTRRTRRPVTRKPAKRPSRTTQKPGKFKPVVPPPKVLPSGTTTQTFEPTTEHPNMINTDIVREADFPLSPGFGGNGQIDYPVAIDKEFSREHVAPIQPILQPDMLSDEDSNVHGNHLAHVSMIGGITLFVIGLATFGAGVVLYCWRKNKGIARARPYDMDGRTLSAHDANDDFMWLDQRESGL